MDIHTTICHSISHQVAALRIWHSDGHTVVIVFAMILYCLDPTSDSPETSSSGKVDM